MAERTRNQYVVLSLTRLGLVIHIQTSGLTAVLTSLRELMRQLIRKAVQCRAVQCTTSFTVLRIAGFLKSKQLHGRIAISFLPRTISMSSTTL